MNSEQILEVLSEHELAFVADLFTAYRLRRFKAIAKIEKPTPSHSLEKANLTALKNKLDNLHQLAVQQVNLRLAERQESYSIAGNGTRGNTEIDVQAISSEGIE